MSWTLQNPKDSEDKQSRLHYSSIFSAATVYDIKVREHHVQYDVTCQYIVLVVSYRFLHYRGRYLRYPMC
jgi:hypothetical protein